MDFTESEYLVEEGFQARVCARLSSFNDDCPVSFPFSVVINTENGTGKNYYNRNDSYYYNNYCAQLCHLMIMRPCLIGM